MMTTNNTNNGMLDPLHCDTSHCLAISTTHSAVTLGDVSVIVAAPHSYEYQRPIS